MAGLSQCSVLGQLILFIDINGIPEGIKPICKIFADSTLLFSIMKKVKLSQNSLNSDSKKNKWIGSLVKNAFQPWSQKAKNGGIFFKGKKSRQSFTTWV